MGKLSNIIPVSDLRQDAAKLLKQLNKANEPLIITQRGRATAVMMGVEAYEKSEREKELLRLLVRGDRELLVMQMTRAPVFLAVFAVSTVSRVLPE